MRKTPEPGSHSIFPKPVETAVQLQSIHCPTITIWNAAGGTGKTPGCSDTKGLYQHPSNALKYQEDSNLTGVIGDKRVDLPFFFFMETGGISVLAWSDILKEFHQLYESGFPFTEAVLSLSQHTALFHVPSGLTF